MTKLLNTLNIEATVESLLKNRIKVKKANNIRNVCTVNSYVFPKEKHSTKTDNARKNKKLIPIANGLIDFL